MVNVVAITGGIGSGKSVVSEILRIMGFKVYDCDSEAKRIIHTSQTIKEMICSKFGNDVIADEKINTKRLADIVFNNHESLKELNSIVHPQVKCDIGEWISSNKEERLLFIETAILEESGLMDMVNKIIIVNAPQSLRIERVMRRNNLTRKDVEARIKRQSDFNNEKSYRILNDNIHPLLPQIISFLALNFKN